MEFGSSQKRSRSTEISSPVKRTKKARKNNKSAFELRKEKHRKLLDGLKNKLKKCLPAVFKKDIGRGNFIFELFCDIIRMNNLIDTIDDMGCLEFVMTEQRISRALDNFFSIRGVLCNAGNGSTTGRCLEKYMTPYRSQFEELCEIGFGGFGYVVKAKHFLDGIDYAVKKVIIEKRHSEKIVKCIDEVKILAQLNHPNVVSYKQAWIEPYTGNEFVQSSQSSQSCSQNGTDYVSSIRKDIELFTFLSTPNVDNVAIVHDEASQSSQEDEPRIVLYIQMSLCHQNLREWMNNRQDFSISLVIEKIMSQTLAGLNYIHNRGVIHHDIKPQNIFISEESGRISVQLGDFGLACYCRKDQHSQEIGTRMYTAPEQIGKKCDPKSDVYSCGLVFFELLYPMETGMERVSKMNDLKNDVLPAEVGKRYPQWVRILKKALLFNPSLRPSADEFLNAITFKESNEVAKLQEEIERLREENNLLKSKSSNLLRTDMF